MSVDDERQYSDGRRDQTDGGPETDPEANEGALLGTEVDSMARNRALAPITGPHHVVQTTSGVGHADQRRRTFTPPRRTITTRRAQRSTRRGGLG